MEVPVGPLQLSAFEHTSTSSEWDTSKSSGTKNSAADPGIIISKQSHMLRKEKKREGKRRKKREGKRRKKREGKRRNKEKKEE